MTVYRVKAVSLFFLTDLPNWMNVGIRTIKNVINTVHFAGGSFCN
jgi:hypothetical protein